MTFSIKEIADHFWCAAMRYAKEQEFGSPKNAKDFEKCWELFKSFEPMIAIDEIKTHIINPRLD